jgi:hypothetical protein
MVTLIKKVTCIGQKSTKEFYDNRSILPRFNGPSRSAHASPFWSQLSNP